MKEFSVVVLSILFLTSCSRYASNGENVYLQSRNGLPMNVPSPLTQAEISHFYDLPTPDSNTKVNLALPRG